jgi:hypothetical protein
MALEWCKAPFMEIPWKTSPEGPDDDGFSLIHAAVEESGQLAAVASALWAKFAADVMPAYAAADWDTVVVELNPIRGLFVFPTSSRSAHRPPGPGLSLLFKNLERVAIAQTLDDGLTGEAFAAARGRVVSEYVAAIREAARESHLFKTRAWPPYLRIEVVP